MTTLAPNPADPVGPGDFSDGRPDDKIQLIIGTEDMIHGARLSGRPVSVRRTPTL